MATINYTTQADIDAGLVRVEWDGLASGDDGQPFDCMGLSIASVHYWGDFNSNTGKITIMGSNKLSPMPADYGELLFSFAPRVQTRPDSVDLTFVASVRPIADASFISGGLCILFVTRRD
jgi:hypothetical protein